MNMKRRSCASMALAAAGRRCDGDDGDDGDDGSNTAHVRRQVRRQVPGRARIRVHQRRSPKNRRRRHLLESHALHHKPQRNMAIPWLLLISPFLISHHTASAQSPSTFETCDIFSDSCIHSFDRRCDRGTNRHSTCESDGDDCFDCDPCQEFNFDCQGCTSAPGCAWCPGDAFCSSAAATQFNMVQLYRHTACPRKEDWVSSPGICQSKPNAVFSDPVYDGNQWAFDMIKVEPVWRKGITGNGVHVRINDDGSDLDHPELSKHADVAGSCQDYLPDTDTDDNEHGTTVASIVGANANNDACSVGIAPNAILSACDVISDTRRFDHKAEVIDISQNSYGRSGCQSKSLRRNLYAKLLASHRRRQRERRHLLVLQRQDDRELNSDGFGDCPFATNSLPCAVCDFATFYTDGVQTEELPVQCTDNIASYCSRRGNFVLDREACTQFLEFFTECDYTQLPRNMERSMLQGIDTGRNGRGIVYVFASGNDFAYGSDANFEGFTNARYTITVGAVGRDGLHADYSTSGAAVFVSAPGGDSGELTTFVVAKVGGGCKNSGIGTSFACPIVSGVIALILEANPELGWRDVQGIIALTSQRVDDPNDDSITTNAAGFWHSIKYGFGIIDANRAVEEAQRWDLFGPEMLIKKESGVIDKVINDDAKDEVLTSMRLDASHSDVVAESVVVLLDLVHASRGDLLITLTSPSGTSSVLHPSRRPENSQLEGNEIFNLMTVRNWGEPVVGNWKLRIVDEKLGDLKSCLDFEQQLFQPDSSPIACNELSSTNPVICENGEVKNDVATQITSIGDMSAVEVCCVCGGGNDLTKLTDRLVSWELLVYGRAKSSGGGEVSQAPTSTPTRGPTKLRSSSPSQSASPSSIPSERPSPAPTMPRSSTPSGPPSVSMAPTTSAAPSLSPSNAPTSVPTRSPSVSPTDLPSSSPTSKPTQMPSVQPSTAPSADPTQPIVPAAQSDASNDGTDGGNSGGGSTSPDSIRIPMEGEQVSDENPSESLPDIFVVQDDGTPDADRTGSGSAAMQISFYPIGAAAVAAVLMI